MSTPNVVGVVVTDLVSFDAEAFVNADGDANSVVNLYSYRVLADPIATTEVTNRYGLFIGNIIAGATLNRAIKTGLGAVEFGDGLVMGVATGGNKGVGTINVATDIFKNNTAYANPDYVFEKAFTGKIEKFADNPGAKDYREMTLGEIERYARKHLRLPGISLNPMGTFERSDKVLEKLEQLFLFLFDLDKKIERNELRRHQAGN